MVLIGAKLMIFYGENGAVNKLTTRYKAGIKEKSDPASFNESNRLQRNLGAARILNAYYGEIRIANVETDF